MKNWAGLIIILIGASFVIRPKIFLYYDAWRNSFSQLKREQNAQTYLAVRILGVLMIIFGIVVAAGIMQ